MFHIQDPYFSNSYTLHEALIESCSNSIIGYGAFAFASKSGIEILLKDDNFSQLLDRGHYSIIVGIDEITNTASIEALSAIKRNKPNLLIKAFCHSNKGSLFHPKVSFFKHENGEGSLIVGSGNLTIGGLRRNREAFSLVALSKLEFIKVETYWKSWLQESEKFLKDIDEDEVIRRVNENNYEKFKKINKLEVKEVEKEDSISIDNNQTIEESWLFNSDSKILLAEIPKSGDRWKQANFDIDNFQNFFGATPGDNSQRILLRHLNQDCTLAPIEIRPSVSVKSKNYRFELDAASDWDYPEEGRPIGVFIQLTTRMFLYHLYMPSQENYTEIKQFMDSKWTGRIDRMIRVNSNAHEMNHLFNQSFFNQYFAQKE